MSDPFDVLDEEHRQLLVKEKQPSWTDPMLAVLGREAFSDPDWIFEPKLDGVRTLVFKNGADVEMMSRNRRSIGGSYPELVGALAQQPIRRFIVDAEIVAFKGRVPSFSRLQSRMHVRSPSPDLLRKVPVFLYVFDILHLDGMNADALPLRERKKVVKMAVHWEDPLKFVSHRNENGQSYLQEICAKSGLEGLIAKRADAPYTHGRSRDWVKLKCSLEQELVIGGYTDPQGSRVGFGALLVGYHEDGKLFYAGKVGTGFDNDLLRTLGRRLKELERERSPFVQGAGPKKAHWVKPQLVGQFGFSEWTNDGRLRHPRFLGLRTDKDPKDVVRERPPDA